MTARWRGTVVYLGSLAVLGTAGFAKYELAQPEGEATHGSHAAGHSGHTMSPTPDSDATAATPAPEQVTITGAVAETREGHVQVAVTFQGATIVDVIALKAGHGGEAADAFNARILPILREAALAAQSAQIDTVTGATYTSEGYRHSLQSAIDQLG